MPVSPTPPVRLLACVLLCSSLLAAVCAGGDRPAGSRSGTGTGRLDRPPTRPVLGIAHSGPRPAASFDDDADTAEPPRRKEPVQPDQAAAPAIDLDEVLAALEFADVVPASSEERIIDLPTALRLAEVENPTIALGRQAISEAVSLHNGARAMLLPTLNAGSNYHLHQGNLQTSFGQIRDVNSQSIYFGAGARTLAAETIAIPGVRIFSHLGDAYYAPLAAGQIVSSRSSDSIAIGNSTLLAVVERYLELAMAESTLDAIHQGEAQMRQIVLATSAFARTGAGRAGDFNRACTDALLLHSTEQRTQEAVAVAAAELSRVLHLDPSIRLKTQPGAIETVQLIDPGYDLPSLVQIAQSARPEVAARSADLAAAEYRVQQENVRPLLPVISVGFSGGAFGGGSNRQDLGVPSFFQTLGGRTDFDAMAVWSMQNLGWGNSALQKQRCAERDQATAARGLVNNRIAREVGDAYARAESRRQQVVVARGRLEAARSGAREEIARTRGGEGLPIEALNSVNLLAEAGRALVEAIGGYDMAQFELFVAIGQTPHASLPDPRQGAKLPPQREPSN